MSHQDNLPNEQINITEGNPFFVPLPSLPRGAKELRMLWINPGTFLMGSPQDEVGYDVEDQPQFEATFSKGFWLGQNPVTQAQWQMLIANNPSQFQQYGPDCPVENINWHQAIEFCRVLNEKFVNIFPNGYGFTLPTET